MHINSTAEQKTDFVEPRRNNYFYGQMMGVHQFEMQTHYHMAMHRRINRLILGYGVACGLDVKKSDTKYPGIVVTSGFAIDKIGWDLIVPEQTMPIPVPGDVLPPPPAAAPESVKQEKEYKHKEHDVEFVHVVLCYYECKSDPAPILAGDCEGTVSCAPGAIRERYRVELRRGKAAPPSIADGRFPDVIEDGNLDYNRLVQWVTEGCPAYPDDPCIPLANICLRVEDDRYCFDERDININVRPIVYTNDLLFDLLMALLIDSPRYRRGK